VADDNFHAAPDFVEFLRGRTARFAIDGDRASIKAGWTSISAPSSMIKFAGRGE